LSGNFIVSISRNPYDGKVWVSALPAEDPGEYRALNYTYWDKDGTLYWKHTLDELRPYNIRFDDLFIYAATEQGLYVSRNSWSWSPFRRIYDEEQDDWSFSDIVYVAQPDSRGKLWVGTADGLAYTTDSGGSWKLFRRFITSNSGSKVRFYAYPNPFSPSRHNVLENEGFVRFQYDLTKPASVFLEIYDFSMDRIIRLPKRNRASAGNYHEVWNGRNEIGDIIANGTYFCKLTFVAGGKKEYRWTKLVVLD
jgi:hypothetical protein